MGAAHINNRPYVGELQPTLRVVYQGPRGSRSPDQLRGQSTCGGTRFERVDMLREHWYVDRTGYLRDGGGRRADDDAHAGPSRDVLARLGETKGFVAIHLGVGLEVYDDRRSAEISQVSPSSLLAS